MPCLQELFFTDTQNSFHFKKLDDLTEHTKENQEEGFLGLQLTS